MLEAVNVRKEYPTPRGPLEVIADASLSLERGAAAAIMGPSGSGKSTLLYILGALEPPTSGSVRVDGRDPYALSEAEQAAFRNQQVGFVFQDHCLLPQLTVLENVLAPTLVHPRRSLGREAFAVRASELLEAVGLRERLDHVPAALSGGEKQRVALARALIAEPALLLCDEPTGNLDRATAEAVAAMLVELDHLKRTVMLVVTHNPELAARFPARFELVSGRLAKV